MDSIEIIGLGVGAILLVVAYLIETDRINPNIF